MPAREESQCRSFPQHHEVSPHIVKEVIKIVQVVTIDEHITRQPESRTNRHSTGHEGSQNLCQKREDCCRGLFYRVWAVLGRLCNRVQAMQLAISIHKIQG
eukprot:6458825-Amphidinium_carterae.1